jgi:hypothetical protein
MLRQSCLLTGYDGQDADPISKLHGSDYTSPQLHYLKAVVRVGCYLFPSILIILAHCTTTRDHCKWTHYSTACVFLGANSPCLHVSRDADTHFLHKTAGTDMLILQPVGKHMPKETCQSGVMSRGCKQGNGLATRCSYTCDLFSHGPCFLSPRQLLRQHEEHKKKGKELHII